MREKNIIPLMTIDENLRLMVWQKSIGFSLVRDSLRRDRENAVDC